MPRAMPVPFDGPWLGESTGGAAVAGRLDRSPLTTRFYAYADFFVGASPPPD